MMHETYLKQLRQIANELAGGEPDIGDDALLYACSAIWEMWQNHVPGIVQSLWPMLDEQARLVAYVTAKRMATTRREISAAEADRLYEESPAIPIRDSEVDSLVKATTEQWRNDVVIGWRKQSDAITPGEYWVRWTSPGGLYYWLHPVDGRWVSEPEQITMPTWPTSQAAYAAASKAPPPQVSIR